MFSLIKQINGASLWFQKREKFHIAIGRNKYKVADFSQGARGLLYGVLLVHMGAKVVKIKPLTGDIIRLGTSGAWAVGINLNKKGVFESEKLKRKKESQGLGHVVYAPCALLDAPIRHSTPL